MLQLSDWQERAQALRFIDKALINGKLVASLSGATFASINPATQHVLAHVAACDAADVDVAVKAARDSFEAGVWSRIAPRERQAVLLKLAELILQHREEFALLDSLNMGKPVMDAYTIDVPGAAGVLRWYAESIDKICDQVAPTAPNALATITREALGVVAAVVPWNFPLDMAIWKLAPALAAGNSVVLKPAEQSPFSALRLAELALEAGMPAGVFNVVPGLGETAGKALGLQALRELLYALEQFGVLAHASFVGLKEFFTLGFELWVLRRGAQRQAQHAARAGAHKGAVVALRQRGQATCGAQSIGRGPQVRGTVQQRAV